MGLGDGWLDVHAEYGRGRHAVWHRAQPLNTACKELHERDFRREQIHRPRHDLTARAWARLGALLVRLLVWAAIKIIGFADGIGLGRRIGLAA